MTMEVSSDKEKMEECTTNVVSGKEENRTEDRSKVDKSCTEEYLNKLFQSLIANCDDCFDEDSNDGEVVEININHRDQKYSDYGSCSTEINNDAKENSPKIVNKREKIKKVRGRSPESGSDTVVSKRKKKDFQPPKLKEADRDIFCWRCHKFGEDVIPCNVCPRVFHLKCSHLQEKPSDWFCTECDAIASAEKDFSSDSVTKSISSDRLKVLLKFVLKRMRHHEGSSHFENLVDPEQYPDYKDYIVKPMYLKLLEENIEGSVYNNCEAFLSDAKWMVHNSYIFNTAHSELTLYARAMLKHAKHECEEILNCPDCYHHANTLEEDEWFIEPCDIPHILVWARLKGWPFWPCKVMKVSGNNVDVRFFGDHNKSVVPAENCYLYSKQTPSKQKKFPDLEIAIKEAHEHIGKLENRFGEFRYAPLKVLLNPKEEQQQRKFLLPQFYEGMTVEEAREIQAKLKKEECKVTIVMSGSRQRPLSRNNNPAITVISKRQGEIRRPIQMATTNDEVVDSRHLLPMSSKRLLHKSAGQSSSPTIVIEDSDSDENIQDVSDENEKVADKSDSSSGNEISSLLLKNTKSYQPTSISNICSKGRFLSHFNLTRAPQSLNDKNSDKEICENISIAPSTAKEYTVVTQGETKGNVFRPIKIISTVSKPSCSQKKYINLNKFFQTNNSHKIVIPVNHTKWPYSANKETDSEPPNTSVSLNSIRIVGKDMEGGQSENNDQSEISKLSPSITNKECNNEEMNVETEEHILKDKINNEKPKKKKEVFKPVVLLKKLNDAEIEQHISEKRAEDQNKDSLKIDLLNGDISDYISGSQNNKNVGAKAKVNEEDEDTSDKDESDEDENKWSSSETEVTYPEKCVGPNIQPASPDRADEEQIQMYTKGFQSISNDPRVSDGNQESEKPSQTANDDSKSKTNFEKSRKRSFKVKLPFSTYSNKSVLKKYLEKVLFSSTSEIKSENLFSPTRLLAPPHKRRIYLKIDDLKSNKQNNLTSLVQRNYTNIKRNENISASTTCDDSSSSKENVIGENNSTSCDIKNSPVSNTDEIIGSSKKRFLSDEESQVDIVKHKIQAKKKRHVRFLLTCEKPHVSGENSIQEDLPSTKGEEVVPNSQSNIEPKSCEVNDNVSDNEYHSSDQLSKENERTTKSKSIEYDETYVEKPSIKNYSSMSEDNSDYENERGAVLPSDNMEMKDNQKKCQNYLESRNLRAQLDILVDPTTPYGCKVVKAKEHQLFTKIHLEGKNEAQKETVAHFLISENPIVDDIKSAGFTLDCESVIKKFLAYSDPGDPRSYWDLTYALSDNELPVKDYNSEKFKQIKNNNSGEFSLAEDNDLVIAEQGDDMESSNTNLPLDDSSYLKNIDPIISENASVEKGIKNKELLFSNDQIKRQTEKSFVANPKADTCLCIDLTKCNCGKHLIKEQNPTIPLPFGSRKKIINASKNVESAVYLHDCDLNIDESNKNSDKLMNKFFEEDITFEEEQKESIFSKCIQENSKPKVHVKTSQGEIENTGIQISVTQKMVDEDNGLENHESLCGEFDESISQEVTKESESLGIHKRLSPKVLENNSAPERHESLSEEVGENLEKEHILIRPPRLTEEIKSKRHKTISPEAIEVNVHVSPERHKAKQKSCEILAPESLKENNGAKDLSITSPDIIASNREQENNISVSPKICNKSCECDRDSEKHAMHFEDNQRSMFSQVNDAQKNHDIVTPQAEKKNNELNSHQVSKMKDREDNVSPWKEAENAITGKPNIKSSTFAMYLQKFDECLKSVPITEDILFLQREFHEVQEKLLMELEDEKRTYIEEMDALYTLEKEAMIENSKEIYADEMKMMVDEIKKKQWCILCLNEAKFHCCWSTSYCSEKCQIADWPTHSKDCAQYKMKASDPDLVLSPMYRELVRRGKVKSFTVKEMVESFEEEEVTENDRVINFVPRICYNDNVRDCNSSSSSQTSDQGRSFGTTANSTTISLSKLKGKTIHVPKEGTSKGQATVQVLKSSSDSDNSAKQVLFKIPMRAQKGRTLVSVGQASPPNSLSTYTIAGRAKPHMVLMGKNKYILPKALSSAKIIGTTVSKATPSQEHQKHTEDSSSDANVVITLPKSPSSLQIGSKTLNVPPSKETAILVFQDDSGASVKYKVSVPENVKSPESSPMSGPSTSRLPPITGHSS